MGIIWGEGIAVKLRFKPDVAWRVKESRWHPSQQLDELADGGCLLTVSVASMMELGRWVRGWGDRVEVIEPASLREELREEAIRLARQYSAPPKRSPRVQPRQQSKRASAGSASVPLAADQAPGR
jgi:predicted DNA-binding transcriptional regulator YafY